MKSDRLRCKAVVCRVAIAHTLRLETTFKDISDLEM